MNTRETVQALLEVEAKAKALDSRRTELRDILDDHLRGVWETEGIASTLKAPGLGSVTLAGCDSTTTEVVDGGAFHAWAVENHPESVAVVIRLQGTTPDQLRAVDSLMQTAADLGARITTEVDPGLLVGLAKGGVANEGRLFTEDGQVEGVEVRAKRPFLSVKLDREAKARAVAALEGVPTEVSA